MSTSHGPVDGRSMTIKVGAGLNLEQIDQLVRPHSLSIGPVPSSLRTRTLAEMLEGPWAGLHAVPGGRLENWCTSVVAEFADGRRMETSNAPRSAAGPDLSALILGAEGRFARVIEATIRCRPLGDRTISHSWPFTGIEDLKRAIGSGATPWDLTIDPVHHVCTATLSGTVSGIERDRQSLGITHAEVHPIEIGPSLHECTWADVALTLSEGTPLRLHRLSLATVVAEGGSRGLPLDQPSKWSDASMTLSGFQRTTS